jgi:hypothetical protein
MDTKLEHIWYIYGSMEIPKNAIEITHYFTWMGADGIARTKIKPGSSITITHARENSLAVNSLPGPKFPLLIDSRDIRSMTKEAREFFSTNGRETKINSMAVVINSPISRVIGNFFLGINKPPVPTRLFDNPEDAANWLKQYL